MIPSQISTASGYINEEKFAKFAHAHNSTGKYSRCERWMYYGLLVLYPPFSEAFYWYRKQNRAKKVKQQFLDRALDELKEPFWASLEDRLLNRTTKALKFTDSRDHNLAYIDLIDLKREKQDYEGPALPLTLMMHGSGTLLSPYSLNSKLTSYNI